MNRESLPLILALLVPIALVLIISMYYYGHEIDVIPFLKTIPIVYYIVIFPIILGFIVIIVKYRKTN